MALLEIKNLKTYFTTKRGIIKAVNDASYAVEAGKTLGIVGESGSGKSVSALSVLKLLDGNGYVESGQILLDEYEAAEAPDPEAEEVEETASNAADFINRLNPNSLTVMPDALVEPAIAEAPVGARFQFLRMGYFCKDPDSSEGKPVYNRIVPLKDTWAKVARN